MTTSILHEDGGNFPFLHQYDKYVLHVSDCIAGGFAKNAVLGKAPRDLDMYFAYEENYEDTKQRMLNDDDHAWHVKYDTGHATCMTDGKVSIDLVKYHFGTPSDIINDFDFSICKFAWVRVREDSNEEPEAKIDDSEVSNDGYPFEAFFSPLFFEHLSMKRLVIDEKLPLPLSTFQRMFKYTRYGYNMCRESKVKLLVAIREMHIEGDVDDELAKTLYEGMD